MLTTLPRPALTTEAFAAGCGVKAPSVRVRLCRTGSYFGVRPIKLPSGRLLWPPDAIEQLTAQGKERSA
jgi:hypothetical protein